MLTAEQTQLWDRINNFQLDDPQAVFKFSERLARENGWSIHYTHRVLTEYKKFIFLCCVSEKGVTPSDSIDQAWHLHLAFTRSYWIDLCRDTIGREVHHNPTSGGESEAIKYDIFYTDTSQLYFDYFNEQPPVDIWPANEARFNEVNFQRVNLDRYWLIRKPRRIRVLLLMAMLILVSWLCIQASDNDIFILIFLVVFVGITALSYHSEGHDSDKRDRDGSGGGSGCGTTGCGADGDFDSGNHGHSGHGCHSGGHSGCGGHSGSGCSGCSASGCSGCSSH
jgi:hypothetical protein